MQNLSMKSQLLLIVDLGSSAIRAMVVDIYQDMAQAILATYSVSTEGYEKGEVVDFTRFQNAVNALLQKINTEHLVEINQVKVLISPVWMRSLNSHGIARVLQDQVSEYDVQRAQEIVRTIPVASEECILHSLDQQYLLDYIPYDHAPIGQTGTRLECFSHLVIVRKNLVKAIEQTFKSLGISFVTVEYAGLKGIDVEESVIEDGVAVLNIGSGLSHLTVYSRSRVVLTEVLALGAQDMIHEIENRFNCESKVAKVLFEQQASLSFVVGENTPFIEIKVAGQNIRVDRAKLVDLIQQGYQVILDFVTECLGTVKGVQLGHGLFIVGGGSRMPNLKSFAEKKLRTNDVKVISHECWTVKGAVKASLRPRAQVKQRLLPKLKTFWQVHF
jgi:cell division protein FtsA